MNAEHLNVLLEEMQRQRASDLYLTHGSPPALRVNDAIVALSETPLLDADLNRYIRQALTAEQLDEFHSTHEYNTALNWHEDARFRVNVFHQQGYEGMVIRRIEMNIPAIDTLGLPPIYGEASLLKRGLVIIAGPTGSGKSTSLAAMVGHRNRNGQGHIITIEDPIEFIHRHQRCIITQRDVGLDTYSYAIALKNALRQRPDMVVIGEVRDREVMEQAIYFAETGHLCVITLHANNSSQAIERILNFFPEERHQQVLLNLGLNLRAVLSQRLVSTVQNGNVLALEIMINRGLIKQLILGGKVNEIRDMIEKNTADGMHTFDQHLFELYKSQHISEETALNEADIQANLQLMINNHKRATGQYGNGMGAMVVGKTSIKRSDGTDF